MKTVAVRRLARSYGGPTLLLSVYIHILVSSRPALLAHDINDINRLCASASLRIIIPVTIYSRFGIYLS